MIPKKDNIKVRITRRILFNLAIGFLCGLVLRGLV